MKWINAEQQVTVTIYDEEHEEHHDKIMTVEEMLDAYTNEGCPTMYFCPERKPGRWTHAWGTDGIIWKCSECGFEIDAYGCVDPVEYLETYKFCPNCGSDNREAGDRDA